MAQQEFHVDRSTALYERPVMNVVDPATFTSVKAAVEARFASGSVEKFFKSLQRAGVRVRDFETVLQAGKLGEAAREEYTKLSDGDQGQIREFYLASLEKVELGLRDKYFKLYAYY